MTYFNKAKLGPILFFLCFCNLFCSPITKASIKQIDTLAIQYYLNKAICSQAKQEKDSAVYYTNKVLYLITPHQSNLSYNINLQIGDFLLKGNNYTAALEFYMNALKKLDNRNNSSEFLSEYVSVYKNLAYCLHIYNPKQSAAYLHKGLSTAEQAFKKDSTYPIGQIRMTFYNNLGSLYIDNGFKDSADFYYKQAFIYRNPKDHVRMERLYNNQGIINAQNGKIDNALQYFSMALNCINLSGDSSNIANIYLNLGNCFLLQNTPKKALRLFTKASGFDNENLRTKYLIEKALSETYEQLDQPTKALHHLHIANNMKDSLLNHEKLHSSINTELQYQYQKWKTETTYKQAMEQKRRSTQTKIFMMLTVILLLGLLTLALFYKIQRAKAKQVRLKNETLKLHNENLELKSESLKQELNSKEKELAIHARYLLNRDEFVSGIIEQINQASIDSGNQEINKILKDIQSNIQSSVWNEFKMLFQNLHNDFYVHLYEKHPNLTTNEKRLCTFIRLNLSSKEISSITQQSIKSIEIARSRLRAKLGLKREDNLGSYLGQF